MTREEMEARRMEAAPLLAGPHTLRTLADRFDVSRTTVMRWRRIVKAGKSLALSRAPGRTPKLDRNRIKPIYLAGPRAAGFDRDRWTQNTFAQAIESKTGIRYDPDHVGRMIHQLNLKPKRARKTTP